MNYRRPFRPVGSLTDNLFGDAASAAAYAGASIFPGGSAALTASYLFDPSPSLVPPDDPAPVLGAASIPVPTSFYSIPFLIAATLGAIGLFLIMEKK